MSLIFAATQNMAIIPEDIALCDMITENEELYQLSKEYEVFVRKEYLDGKEVILIHNTYPVFMHYDSQNIFELPDVECSDTFESRATAFIEKASTLLKSGISASISDVKVRIITGDNNE